MSMNTIQYRREYVHFKDNEIKWNGVLFESQDDAHKAICENLKNNNKEFPCLMSDLKHEINITNDGDSWGTCCNWMFALAEWCFENNTLVMPFDWSSGLGGSDFDSYEYEFYELMQPTNKECEYLAELLNLWYRKLKNTNRSY